MKTYQLAYEEQNGAPAPGATVDHTCRNKLCHNPRHLEAVPDEENTRRRQAWARQHAAARV